MRARIGILVASISRIPEWAVSGVRTARLFLKTGVVLLGALYSATELAQLGALSVVMIGIFVLGSVGLVLYLGRRMQAGNFRKSSARSATGWLGCSRSGSPGSACRSRPRQSSRRAASR